MTKRGRREADAIAERLGREPIARLVSSPFTRCVQTLEPLAVALDLPIETTDLLAEGADGMRAHDLLLSLGNDGHAIACCTHGDVLSEVADGIARSGVTLDGPRDAPVGSSWILEVDVDRFLSARFVERPPR